MGEWVPLYISLALILVIGGFIPSVISGFVDPGVYNYDSFISPLINFVEDGFTIADVTIFGWNVFDGINFNPFDWFGSSFNSYLVTQLSAFSYIPDYIAIPLIIFCVAGFVYSVIKILPTT